MSAEASSGPADLLPSERDSFAAKLTNGALNLRAVDREALLGGGKPFFAGPRSPLRLLSSDRIGENVIRITYVPA